VEVETPAGRLTPQAVIVTVSTSALLAGAIKFTPDLPKRQLDALGKLGLGSYDRIALELAGNPLGLARDDVVIEQSTDARTALLRANIAGSTLCTVDVAGQFGRELASRGEADMVAFAQEWLAKLYGSDLKSALRRSRVTRWNAVPGIMGAMSVASVGGQPSRRILMEPLNSVFFAGEAAHETLCGTVAGAWESGERAAEAALRRIGALKPLTDETATPRPKRRKSAAQPSQ
jgi:monoamine oxidase